MASQLSRQLWQTINDLRRAYRQAMRFAVQSDPHGSEQTSDAWKTVAHRRALLEDMLKAAAPFLGPEPAPVKRPSRSRASSGGRTSRSTASAAREGCPAHKPKIQVGHGQHGRGGDPSTPGHPASTHLELSSLNRVTLEPAAEQAPSSPQDNRLSADNHLPEQESSPNFSLPPRRTLETIATANCPQARRVPGIRISGGRGGAPPPPWADRQVRQDTLPHRSPSGIPAQPLLPAPA
jgi:hypothetical protein